MSWYQKGRPNIVCTVVKGKDSSSPIELGPSAGNGRAEFVELEAIGCDVAYGWLTVLN